MPSASPLPASVPRPASRLLLAAGEMLVAGSITRRLIEHFTNRPIGDSARRTILNELTDRELEVLKHLARGLSNTEIAEQLIVSEATVRTHVSSVLAKLRLRGRVQAVVLAYESGLVQLGAS